MCCGNDAVIHNVLYCVHSCNVHATNHYNHLCLQTSSSQIYDVYRDSNVAEVVKCRPVLDALVKRVSELLAEFPEWPTLVQVSTVTHFVLLYCIIECYLFFIYYENRT